MTYHTSGNKGTNTKDMGEEKRKGKRTRDREGKHEGEKGKEEKRREKDARKN